MPQVPDTLILDPPTHETLHELEEQIQRRLRGRVRDFQLILRDDGLVLRGHTCTYYAKQLAQHAVMEATDLPIRANEIKVVGIACS
jgi:23S rRNA G2069 N7-methylase RlmK/C1962 C5-methylase RlmI